MAKTVQLKRGTTAQTNAYTGPAGEVTVDTDKDLPVVHDGTQAGGFAVAARANADGSVSFINRAGTIVATISSAGLETSARKLASSAGSATDASVQVVSATNGLFAPAANDLGIVTNGVERQRIGSAGEFSRTIPGGSTLYPDFACRAWVNFNGTNGAVRGSGNITVVRNSVGLYTLSFSAAMPDINYTVVSRAGRSDSPGANNLGGGPRQQSDLSTTSVIISSNNQSNGSVTDTDHVSLSIFR